MKKLIIGALVASIILFVWQFLSWAALNIHGSSMQYTENQDTILEFLDGKLTTGSYYLPMAPPGSSGEEHQAVMEENLGEPWALIQYREELSSNMGSNMIRGWVIDFISALLICWVLLKFANLNMISVLGSCIAIGLIGYFTISYLNSIWFEGNTFADLIDAVVQWGLCGLWLGWYLPEKKPAGS